MSDIELTPEEAPKFNFAAYPPDTFFHERRGGKDRRRPAGGGAPPGAVPQPRSKKDRRRRIDPTTFEKQYTPDELEFMTAMQSFKDKVGRSFPTYREVIAVAASLGYRKPVVDEND